MQPTDSPSLFPDQKVRDASRPPFQVVRANKHGLVLESQRDFEIGSTVAIGFHVDNPRNISKSKFISIEAVVVGSKSLIKRERRSSVRHITLLFSEIEHEDRDLLLNFPENSPAKTKLVSGVGSLN